MLTVCNNGRVAVTIEVEILAFPREGGRSSDPAKIFLWIWYCVQYIGQHRVTRDPQKWPISPQKVIFSPKKLSFFLHYLTISCKWTFIPKYVDLRTFVLKISRVTFTHFAHRFDCSGQAWSQGSQNWFKYFRDRGIPTLKGGECSPTLRVICPLSRSLEEESG